MNDWIGALIGGLVSVGIVALTAAAKRSAADCRECGYRASCSRPGSCGNNVTNCGVCKYGPGGLQE